MVSFQDLPQELFVIILETLINTSHPKDHSIALKVINLVSKEWLAISQSTSSIWRTLSSADPPAWVERVLENSAHDGPLSVRFVRFAQGRYANRLFERLVMPHIDRWVDFRIDWPFIPEEGGILTTRAPKLRRLSVYSPDHLTPPLELFGDQIPQLRSLSLDNQIIPWESRCLRSTSLQCLFISNPCLPRLPYSTLFDILASCPNLARLSIHNVLFQYFSDREGPPIVMAHLTHIDLQIPLEPVHLILKRLELSALVKFAVNIQSSKLSRYLLHSLTPILDRFLRIAPTESNDLQNALQYSKGWFIKANYGSFSLGTPFPDAEQLSPLLSRMSNVPVAVVCNATPSELVYSEAPRVWLFNQITVIHKILHNVTHLRLPVECPGLSGILNAMIPRPSAHRYGIFPMTCMIELEERSFKSEQASSFDVLDGIARLIASRRSQGEALKIRNRLFEAEVEEEQRAWSRRFPNSFVFGDEKVQAEWWDRPEAPIDPDYEVPYYEI